MVFYFLGEANLRFIFRILGLGLVHSLVCLSLDYIKVRVSCMNFLVGYLKPFMYVTMLATNKDMAFFNICVPFIFSCLNIIAKTSIPTMKINGHSRFLYLILEFSVNALNFFFIKNDVDYYWI